MKITKKQLEAARLFEGALGGDLKATNALVEGISTSDIPVQLSPTFQKIALNQYEGVEKIWTKWAGREVVDNFESQPYYDFTWGDETVEPSTAGKEFVSGSLPHIPEYDEYPTLTLAASDRTLQTRKGGVQVKFSWEALQRNRNFNLVNRAFEEFGQRAGFLENEEATRPLVTGQGLNATNFNEDNQNLLPGNPSLSLDALEAAIEHLATQTYNGRRVRSGRYVLVVPRTLEMQARRILAIDQITEVDGAGTENELRYVSGNPVAGKFELVVNDYITDIAGSAADNYWFILPVPGSQPNPSVVNVFLSGEETPKVFVRKTTNSAPEEGDYIDDSYSTKTRHVVAGGFILPAGTLVSTGESSS